VTALAYNIQGDVPDIIIPETINPLDPVKRSLGEKQYELSNHLGNVLVTVSDRKLAEGTEGSTATGYRAEVLFASDYYPFGMQMPGRIDDVISKYRYGFNGMEKDDEFKGEGNSYDFGARMYDSRIGRFLSVDPRTNEFPHIAPYVFAGNKPINHIDFGGEHEFLMIYNTSTGTMTLVPVKKTDNDVKHTIYRAISDISGNVTFIDESGAVSATPVMVSPSKAETQAINNMGIAANNWSLSGEAFRTIQNINGLANGSEEPITYHVDKNKPNSTKYSSRNYNRTSSGSSVPGMPLMNPNQNAGGTWSGDVDGDGNVATNQQGILRGMNWLDATGAYTNGQNVEVSNIQLIITFQANSTIGRDLERAFREEYGESATITFIRGGVVGGPTSGNDYSINITWDEATPDSYNEQPPTQSQ